MNLVFLAVGLLAAGAAAAPAAPTATAHVDNPYVGAVGYRNPEWTAQAAAEPGGARVAGNPTAVWLNTIASIDGLNGAMGLRAHLDTALDQGAGYIQLVVDNLPGKDCDRLYSQAELVPDELARYRAEYIDAIAGILAEPQYAGLRIVTIIAPRALPNLVVNTTPQPTATFTCDVVRANGSYVVGIRYALDRLHPIPNVYTYLDVAGHAWTGRDDTFEPVTQLIADTVRATDAGLASVDGFITNTAGYAPLREPFLTVDDETRQSRWIGANRYTDELPFARDVRARLIALGFPAGVGMLIDTSRNGWGGPDRPTAPSTDPDVNVRVDESRVDRRAHKENWCNQVGSGLGERPRAEPEAGIDAYVWAQPPGISDGTGAPSPIRGFDRMCDPTYPGGTANGFNFSTAMPGTAEKGDWFPALFQQLLANAHPPLD